MTNHVLTWQAIKPGATEGEQADKSVTTSDFSQIRAMRLDREAAGRTRVSYELSGMWFGQSAYHDTTYETLEISGAGAIEIEGAPELPQEGLFVAIPENADVTEVTLLNKDEEEIGGEHLVRPASKPVREMEEPEYIPNKKIYDSDEPYPGEYFKFMGTKRVAGRKVAHIMLYPAQYYPRSKRLVALKSILLEVRYRTEAGKDAVGTRRITQSTPLDCLILDAASQFQEETKRIEREEDSGTDDVSLRGRRNAGKYLIITTEGLKESVKPLATARANDFSVKVVTKSEIVREFPNINEDEAIRNFLIHASDNWEDPPQWVTLAGDTGALPTHLQDLETEPGQLASDHFYSDLRGDLIPELVVSRLATSDPEEMERICVRAACLGEHDTPWGNKLLFLTFNHADYIKCADEVAATVGNRFEVIKKYDGQATKDQVIEVINQGIGLINYRGHGSETAWSAGNGLSITDVPDLNNGDKLPAVLSIACWNNCIDFDGTSFGECWVRNEKAVAFLGASRPSWTKQNHDFDKFLFEAIIDKGLTRIGDIMNFGKAKLYQQSTESPCIKDNIRMYLLLGDPCAKFGGIGE